MTFRPGELDKRITLRRESLTPDGQGGNHLTVADYDTVWAHVRPLSGREREQFDRVNAEASYLFVIRNRQDIRENDRVLWEGVEYNIRLIKGRAGRPLYLEIIGDRGVAQ